MLNNMNDRDFEEMIREIIGDIFTNPKEVEKRLKFVKQTERKLDKDDELFALCREKGMYKDDAINFMSTAVCSTITLLEQEIFPTLLEYCSLFPNAHLNNEQKALLLELAIKKGFEYAERPNLKEMLDEGDKEKTINSEKLNELNRSSYDEGAVVIAVKAVINPLTGEAVDAIPYKVEDGELIPLDFKSVDKELQDKILKAIKKRDEAVYRVFCDKHNIYTGNDDDYSKKTKEDTDLEIKKRFFSEVFGINFDDKGIR